MMKTNFFIQAIYCYFIVVLAYIYSMVLESWGWIVMVVLSVYIV